MHWITVVNGHVNRHRCLLHTRAEKLQLLETCKSKLRDARRHSYRVKQVLKSIDAEIAELLV